jgi:hypothetical protein
MAKQQHIKEQSKRWGLAIGMIVIFAIAAGVFLLVSEQPRTPAPNPSLPASYVNPKTDYEKLIGDWGRTDGDYVIRISSTAPEGTIQAAYFNPNPIHVAQATVAYQNNVIQFFMELRDIGYPGSKYNLVYNAGQDTLEGTYFQAQAQQVYDVAFQRIIVK